jgi:hypothetical protein
VKIPEINAIPIENLSEVIYMGPPNSRERLPSSRDNLSAFLLDDSDWYHP